MSIFDVDQNSDGGTAHIGSNYIIAQIAKPCFPPRASALMRDLLQQASL
jgi:hypothetical protein